jgi:hypothetical protein
MALPAGGSLSTSCWGCPCQVQVPRAVRLGQGSRIVPAPRGGRTSTSKVSTYGRPPTSKARNPAPTSVTTARAEPNSISNCAPVGGIGVTIRLSL